MYASRAGWDGNHGTATASAGEDRSKWGRDRESVSSCRAHVRRAGKHELRTSLSPSVHAREDTQRSHQDDDCKATMVDNEESTGTSARAREGEGELALPARTVSWTRPTRARSASHQDRRATF